VTPGWGAGILRRSVRFHVYVLRQLLAAFVFAVAGLLFVALPGIVVSTVHKLPNVEPALLLSYLPLVLKTLAPYVLPLCFMLSVVAVYGRLAADREWIAMQMSGFWPMRFFVPALALATLLAGATYWMVSEELPKLKERQKRFLVDAAASVIENLQPGKTSISLGEFYLKAADRDEETGTFYDAYIRMPEGEDLEGDVFASAVDISIVGSKLRGRLRDWELFVPRGGMSGSGHGENVVFQIDLAERMGGQQRNWDKPRYLTSPEIMAALDDGRIPAGGERPFLYELHRRGAMAAAFFLFLGLGAPTGLLLRRGTQLGALAVAAGYGIAYYLLTMRLGKTLGLSESLPVWLGPWLTTIVGGAAAWLLLQKAIRR
jgi:lipopolysaccharide export LptBFGC system permease protein LptF